MSCMNVRGVQEYLITRIEYQNRSMLLIIVSCYVVLGFADSELCYKTRVWTDLD